MSCSNPTASRLHLLMPVFNDWSAVSALLARIDRVLCLEGISASAVLVDDGSTVTRGQELEAGDRLSAIRCVEVLRLRRNLGHQRAICIGLCHLAARAVSEPIVIMDSDGEDAAEDVPRLLRRFVAEGGRKVVFAARAKRAEGIGFRIGYLLFRGLHRMLTGRGVRVGNFSIVPPQAVAALTTSPHLWSHYAAAVFSSRIPMCSVETDRAKRLDGSSSMDLVALVAHGLAAISVFGETVGVRLLLGCASVGALALVALGAVVAIRLWTSWAVPGWATFSVGLLTLLLFQVLLLSGWVSLLILSGRSAAGFLPCRDYLHFLERSEVLWEQARETAAPV